MSKSPHDSLQPEPKGQFVELFVRYQRQVYLYIRSLLSNPSDVEEVFQQTSLVLWKKFDQYQQGTNFRAWAFRIAHLEILDYRSRQRRNCLCFSDELLDELAEEMDSISDLLDARMAALSKCLKELPKRDRRLIELRYSPGECVRDIAAELNRPVRYIYKAVTRIRRALYECINRRLDHEGVK